MNRLRFLFCVFISICIGGNAVNAQTISDNGAANDSLIQEIAPLTPDYNEITKPKRETQPSFPGGQAELMKYISAHLHYPEEAAKAGITGRVVVQFKVHKDGSRSNIKILKGLSHETDAEVVKLIENMPDWEPATSKGEPIDATYTVPVTFKMQ